jgi:multidrug efflux pump subunit AcrA (membrane-fusion protein)
MSAKRRSRLLVLVALAAVLALGAFAAMHMRGVDAADTLPSAPVRKGEFLELVTCRGELIAGRSVQLVAPNVPDLRIVWQAPASSSVKEGEPVIRFDPSTAKQQLADKQASLQQAEATLEQAVSQARITAEQDKIDLANAKHQVERARLEVSKQEIVSALQGEESRVDLGLAEEKLRVQEATAALHKASDEAKIASLTRVRDKAKDEVDLIEYRMSQMEMKARLAGVIIYMQNYSQGWMNAKPFKVGDRVWPGSTIAEIPDLGTLEMKGKVEEIDRGRIQPGFSVRVHVDALPERTFDSELTLISPLTEQNWEWPPSRNFRAQARLLKLDERLRPGMNGRMDVVVNKIPNAYIVPAKALFTHHGKPVVYVSSGGAWKMTEVEVQARNPDEIAIKGMRDGQNVALVEPDARTPVGGPQAGGKK